jgi:GNAT superfamily N-acetyltransferase
MIRPWQVIDAAPLADLMREFLTETFEDGGDFLPTEQNVITLVQRGIAAADSGDPCLIALEDKPVGFTMVIGVPTGTLDMRGKLAAGVGTFVVRDARRAGWGKRLREAAYAVAKAAGYTRIDGVARTPEALASAKAADCVPAGVFVTKVL